MPPSVVWGIGVGLVIAAIDALTLVLLSSANATQWPVADLNLLANVALYSLIGFRVGRITGVVRDAAESGVLAGTLVALIGITLSYVLRPQLGAGEGSVDSSLDAIGILAQNIAIGGVLAIVTGWLGSRARTDEPPARR